MDLLTRKKLLLRKYNNNLFSSQQLDFFGKINATEIIILLKQNPHLRECTIFFQHTSIRQIEKPEESFIRSETFNILVNILRGSTMILEICFNKEDFNYMSIFGFLEQEHIDYPILILLQDVLLPFIRKSPFHIMDVIVNDEEIEDLILKRVYEKPVFKIMYTVVFCLSKRHTEVYKNSVKRIIHQLVQTPFTYLMHKEKVMSQKISIIAMDKTLMKIEAEKKFLDSSKQLPSIHKKRVRQKKAAGSSISSGELINVDEAKYTKTVSFGLNLNIRTQPLPSSQKSLDSMDSSKKVNHYSSFQTAEMIDMYEEQEIHSMTSLDSIKSIPLNEDLDYADLTFNMKDLFSDIAFNIKSVDLRNVITLLENFNENYIDSLLTNCKRFISNEDYEGYCQGAILILIEFGQLYKSAIKLSKSKFHTSNSSCDNSPTKSDNEFALGILMNKLERELRIIASKVPLLCGCILQNNELNTFYSSGQRLRRIGMTKFKILQLIHQLLQINSKIQNEQNDFNLDLEIDFESFDVFRIAQKYLTTLKWNNLIHSLLAKIIKLSLEQDYEHFKQRYIQHLEKPKDGFLGTLMELFRNKKFVFLKNMKFSNYGNLHAVYQITLQIVKEVKKNNDYETLIKKFTSFDQFIRKDISLYEESLRPDDIQDLDELPILNALMNRNASTQDQNQKPVIIHTSMENAEEVLYEIQNSKRWVPTTWQNSKRKESI